MRGLNETYQIDLFDMQAYPDFNRGLKYLLTVIDVFQSVRGLFQSTTKVLKKLQKL